MLGRRGRGGGGGGPPRREKRAPPPRAARPPATTRPLAAGGSGAAGGAGGAGPPRVEKPDLTVAVVPSTDAAGFFIALYQGLFKAQGLHVTFVPATSSKTVIAGQVKGVYDITGGNYVSYIQAQ